MKAGQLGGGRKKTRGVVDVAMLQSLTRRSDIAALTAGYGLVVVDECHHVPAAAFEHAVKQIPARRWIGLTATPERRDHLDELIPLQVGPTRHTLKQADAGTLTSRSADLVHPAPVLHVHPTAFAYTGEADPQAPGGMAAVYRGLGANEARNRQIVTDVIAALKRGRNCLILTRWTTHLERLEAALREAGHDPVVLRGGMGAKARAAAITRLTQPPTEARCWPSPRARMRAKASTAQRWTRSSSWCPPRSRAPSRSTSAEYSGRTLARPPQRSTTTTMSSPASSPHRWPREPGLRQPRFPRSSSPLSDTKPPLPPRRPRTWARAHPLRCHDFIAPVKTHVAPIPTKLGMHDRHKPSSWPYDTAPCEARLRRAITRGQRPGRALSANHQFGTARDHCRCARAAGVRSDVLAEPGCSAVAGRGTHKGHEPATMACEVSK